MTANKAQDNKPRKAKKLSERYLRNAGEYYLNRFPASSAHFLKVMTRKIDRSCKDHPDQDRMAWITHIRDVLTPEFERIGFLNDDLLARGLFNSYRRKGMSATKIKSKMIQKSVPSAIVETLLTEEGCDDRQAVQDFARKKKIGIYRPEPYADSQEKQKDLGKLARAGFSYDVAISVFE